jgi:hypothetical protein
LFDNAVPLAQTILRADTAANFGESIGGLGQLISFFQTPFGGQAQPIWDVVVERAMRLAVRHAALAATAGLLFGLGGCIAAINLIKIGRARLRLTFFGRLFVQ